MDNKIRYFDRERIISARDTVCKLSKTEYHLVKALPEGRIVPDHQLLHILSDNEEEGGKSLQKTLERHVENIRQKLKPLNLNIYRVAKFGYVILPSNPADCPASYQHHEYPPQSDHH
ncbi:MAG: helix-turn-helix domain-containing protein [Ktedonobacteraceae bacterium]|nr:helix-turn-helix domain-containing protein [Ktedonobacteraceae bacterium]